VKRRTFLLLGLGGALTGVGPAKSADPKESAKDMPKASEARVDRQALVSRHNVRRTQSNPRSPLQVGNGNFAFGADITGLQTFVPFNTLSHWGWHAPPPPTPGPGPDVFPGMPWDTHGKPVDYPTPNPEMPALSQWLYANPNRINLGRLGMRLLKADGSEAAEGDLTGCAQELDLWQGTLDSRFALEGQPVRVQTCCHPKLDAVTVRVESPLIAAGRLSVFLDFPRDDGREFADYVGGWDGEDEHQTEARLQGTRRAEITHRQDSSQYHVVLDWEGGAAFQPPARPATPEALVIVKAEYGAGAQSADVTALLKSAVKDDRLSLVADNATMGGDPALRQVKHLRVSYTLGGRPQQIDVGENGRLQIPSEAGAHRYTLAGVGDQLAFVCVFAPDPLPEKLPGVDETFQAARRHWADFWQSGGAVDLSGSRDPRWHELERRVVLSQYLMAVNEAGPLPPQESGLVNNGWHGKFHMEMYWWHAAHYALWDRWPLLDRSLGIYPHFLPSAKVRAKAEDCRGARWPKMTSAEGRESVHPCNALLIWQQPHPFFFAELDYRAHPTRATLEKWREVLFATGDFLASFAFPDAATGHYVLGPPIYVVSENTDPLITKNPAFELSYWRFGLRLAQTWRQRLGLPPDPEWAKVQAGLAPLPVEDGCYVLYEGVPEMWTRFNFEHPALTGLYGWLPGDGVDVGTARRTAAKVAETWHFDHVWGWDFPMLAMNAARLGQPSQAVDYLLHPAGGFQFDDAGYATGGPFPYFPSNGGLLYAVALMAAGWDGAPAHHAPGFPTDGQWDVRWENLRVAL
jgi:hypothetical protein